MSEDKLHFEIRLSKEAQVLQYPNYDACCKKCGQAFNPPLTLDSFLKQYLVSCPCGAIYKLL